ncbi:LCP family protein [Actinoplanes oblitus]|uniref:LCP family protein n=1 Tax=Actinoplanes oblitus TaxID=3040509 RepID=A0ABY8WFM0_9ACTN|nr:LCP family protein [Actinoplanes oblitus]WIM96654.1 LCP family protein [Actinoplanes oblitus]
MSKVEEELRAAFERHEALVPDAAPVRDRIDFAWVRVKRRRAKQRVIGAAAAVLLAGAALPVVSSGWGHRGSPAGEVAPMVDAATAPITGPVDVLLIGSDRPVTEEVARADTVMLLHVPADRSAAWMISFPRDGAVDIPGFGTDKLNYALSYGGPALVRETVARLTGIEPDATVTVDFSALSAVTDAVGGVRMCLSQAIDPAFGRAGFARGCQQIDGSEVAPLLRARIGLRHGTYDRDQNAQAFLRALATKVSGGNGTPDPAGLPRLLDAAKSGIRVDGNVTGLLAVAGALGKPKLIGIRETTFHPAGDAKYRESIYPAVGDSLYQAIRDDRLAAWAVANPKYVAR